MALRTQFFLINLSYYPSLIFMYLSFIFHAYLGAELILFPITFLLGIRSILVDVSYPILLLLHRPGVPLLGTFLFHFIDSYLGMACHHGRSQDFCIQFLRVWTKNAFSRKFLENFRKFS